MPPLSGLITRLQPRILPFTLALVIAGYDSCLQVPSAMPPPHNRVSGLTRPQWILWQTQFGDTRRPRATPSGPEYLLAVSPVSVPSCISASNERLAVLHLTALYPGTCVSLIDK